MKNENIIYQYRVIAGITIEAETPLAVGSGRKDIITDALVATDINGLPYIPGTAIAGVLRSILDKLDKKDNTDDWFGYQDSKGSEIIFTEAKIIDGCGNPRDGWCPDPRCIENDEFLKYYFSLPIRQHVKLNHRGTAEKHNKFDEQVVFAGTRFYFEIEMLAKDEEGVAKFKQIIDTLNHPEYRLGGGTRNGFGKIKVRKIKYKKLDMTKPEDLNLYLDKPSDLADSFRWWKNQSPDDDKKPKDTSISNWIKYNLNLTPDDFFFFGSGIGDNDVDHAPVRELKVVWENDNNEAKVEENHILIPATSVKGAISHRTAFHYNKLKNVFADQGAQPQDCTGSANEAVRALFGTEGVDSGTQQRGNVIFSDIFLRPTLQDKIFDHVAIDRFTGGAVDGALFNEKATYGNKESFELEIMVNDKNFDDKDIIKAFENALRDICKGLLPLGGATNKGHGIFSGSITKNNEPLNLEEEK